MFLEAKIFIQLKKRLLHHKKKKKSFKRIGKTNKKPNPNPNPSSLKLAMWEYQFVLVRLSNGFIVACIVFVCINIV